MENEHAQLSDGLSPRSSEETLVQCPPQAPAHRLTRPVFIIGFMGAGKTSVTRKLARILGVAEVDADSYLERKGGREISTIFAEEGEEAFRRQELATLDDLSRRDPMLISCGGGVVTQEPARKLLKERGFVVWLAVSPEEAARRVGDASTRPLFSDEETVRALWVSRLELYESVADVCVETGGESVTAVAYRVADELRKHGIIQKL